MRPERGEGAQSQAGQAAVRSVGFPSPRRFRWSQSVRCAPGFGRCAVTVVSLVLVWLVRVRCWFWPGGPPLGEVAGGSCRGGSRRFLQLPEEPAGEHAAWGSHRGKPPMAGPPFLSFSGNPPRGRSPPSASLGPWRRDHALHQPPARYIGPDSRTLNNTHRARKIRRFKQTPPI